MTSVDTRGHVIVGTGEDEMEAGDETAGKLAVGEEEAGMEVLATGEAVGMETDVEVGKDVGAFVKGSAIPPVATGTALDAGLVVQATSSVMATRSTTESPSNSLFTSSMVEEFHMDMFLPVFHVGKL